MEAQKDQHIEESFLRTHHKTLTGHYSSYEPYRVRNVLPRGDPHTNRYHTYYRMTCAHTCKSSERYVWCGEASCTT